MATSSSSPPPSLANERAFIRYLLARTCGTLAVQMQTVAVGWQVYAATSDPLDLGLIGLSQFLPFILLILPAATQRITTTGARFSRSATSST